MNSFNPRMQLEQLLEAPENEVIEFKTCADGKYNFEKLGKYFSALSNEANLHNKQNAWLIFGVDDKRKVVGTSYHPTPQGLNKLKQSIAEKTNNNITFVNIYEENINNKRVLMFEIPSATRGIPTSFGNFCFARNGESLTALSFDKMDRIRAQARSGDWSQAIIEKASLDDLDSNAIIQARHNFKRKNPHLTEDIDSWDDIVFLNKAKLTIKGQITKAALILVGKSESEPFINADPKITWQLQDGSGEVLANEIFTIPFLLSVNKVFQKIRNIKYRYVHAGDIFPEEVDKYEPFAIREAINNCIAHQDYLLKGRINIVERDDSLTFTNKGSFIPGTVERVVMDNAPEEHYRNRFLVQAMQNLNMVDTLGSGIKKMYKSQVDRFFPLPEYDLSGNRVKVTLTGKVIDLDYAKILLRKKDLTLFEIIALDKVQKKQRLNENEIKLLKEKNLIEGRKPNYFISKKVAQETGQKAAYTKNAPLDKDYYKHLIHKLLEDHDTATRKDIDELLWKKLPDIMSDFQKKQRIKNLLSELKRAGIIKNTGTTRFSIWALVSK